MNPLIVDLETTTPGPKPDFRVDEVTQVGWLPLDGDVAKWAGCLCSLPGFNPIVCHSATYDVGVLQRYRDQLDEHPYYDSWLRRINIHDTLALAYAQGKQDLSLKGLGASELGVVTVPYAQRHLIGDEQYLAQDLFLTRDLLKKLLPLNHGTAYDIDRALIPALIDCSYRGYEVDQDRLVGAIVKAELTRERMEAAFNRLVSETSGVVLKSRRKKTTKTRGTEYVEKHGPPAIGSAMQLGQLLGTPDTNKETLAAVAASGGDRGILADLVLRWRKASKALTTYFYPLQGRDKLTGLFNITPNEDMEGGTGTGRLSSERFNMQNQPPTVQRCLRAPEGFLIRRGDFPGIELRCAAEASDDPYLLGALSNPTRDLHQETADFLGIPEGWGGHPARWWGKHKWNFPVLYGAEVPKLAQGLGWPYAKIEAALRRFRQEMWTGFFDWADRHWASVQRTSYSVSPGPFLHRRFIPLLAVGDHARKAAVNHPIQSMAVYICKVAMSRLFQGGSLLANQIHDEVHDYVPEDGDKDLQARNMAGIMESVMREYLPRVGNVPVDVKISKYWSDE